MQKKHCFSTRSFYEMTVQITSILSNQAWKPHFLSESSLTTVFVFNFSSIKAVLVILTILIYLSGHKVLSLAVLSRFLSLSPLFWFFYSHLFIQKIIKNWIEYKHLTLLSKSTDNNTKGKHAPFKSRNWSTC